MIYDRKKTINAVAQWQEKQKYTHFGTAMFKYVNNLRREQVIKSLCYFFNGIDREIYTRKDVDNGLRVERMVYLELGRSRDNLHSHFFYKAESRKQEAS
jgi:hypothetical protein